MKGWTLTLAVLLTLLPASPGAAGFPAADFPLAGPVGGQIFQQSQAPPPGTVMTGFGRASIFRAAPEYGYLYLWANGIPLFNRPGTVFENEPFSTKWLTALDQREQLWTWELPGKINEIAVCQTVAEPDQVQRALDVTAITSFSKAIVIARRQLNLKAEHMPDLQAGEIFIEHPDLPLGVMPWFLKAPGAAGVDSRMDGAVYLPQVDNKWGNGHNLIYVEPSDESVDLPAGVNARKAALKELALRQEKAFMAKVKRILDQAIKAKSNEW